MDTIRKSFSTVKGYWKAIWKSLKKNCPPLLCFRRKTSKYTMNNVSDEATVTAVKNLQEEIMATQFNGYSQLERIPADTSFKTEEGNEHGTNDTEEQRRDDIEEVKKNVCLYRTMDNISDGVMVTAVENVILQEELTATQIDGQLNRIPADTSFKTEEENEHGTNDMEVLEQQRNVNDEIKRKKRKRTNRKRHNNVMSQNTTDEHVSEIAESEEKLSCEPSASNSTEEMGEPVTSVPPSVKLINNETECPVSREFGDVNSGGAHQRSETQPTIIISSTGEGKTQKKVVYMYLSSNKNVVLDKTENAWVPTIATKREEKQVVTDADSTTILETNKSVRSILNKIASENIDVMIKSFMVLPINTVERLENAVDLVFEKAIQEQSYAALYAILCSAVKSIEVACAENNGTTSFKLLMIRKCQSFFESDKVRQAASAKELEDIKSCKDAEKKNELRFEYEENERTMRKRSVGNCCFIGELFNKHVVHPKIIQYCITYLICQLSEEPIECLCNLLRISGKQLEQWCNLNDTFHKLKAMISVKSMTPRMRFMIQDIIDLRGNKWSPRTLAVKVDKPSECKKATDYSVNQRHNGENQNVKTKFTHKQQTQTVSRSSRQELDVPSRLIAVGSSSSKPIVGEKRTTPATAATDVANVEPPESEGHGQSRPHSSSKKARNSSKMTKHAKPDEVDTTEINDKIRRLCSDIIGEYEELQNLDDVIYSLVDDEKSCIRTRHRSFVTSTSLITLDGSANSRTVAGKLFAELLSKNVLTTAEINHGIDTVLKEWNDYVVDYPHFFSYVAAIVAPLLTSKTASFDFNNLKYACPSIRQSGNLSAFFAEILKAILRSEDVQNDTVDDFGGVLRTYNMWREQTKYVPLCVFMPDNEIQSCFKNDQLGILLLSMVMYDMTNMIDCKKSLYKTTHKWIRKNIDLETVKLPGFVRSLTIATATVCSNKPEGNPNEEFFDRDRGTLIKNYVRSECEFLTTEIRAREMECVRGIRAISVALRDDRKPGGDVESRLLSELCRV